MKKLLGILLVLAVLAFVFADSIFYLAGRWQEKTGRVKRAARIYSRLITRYPRSKWVSRAKEAVGRLEKRKGKRKRSEAETIQRVNPYDVGTLKKTLEETKKKVKKIETDKEEEYEKWLKEIGE